MYAVKLFRAGESWPEPTAACNNHTEKLLSYVLNSCAIRGFMVQLKRSEPSGRVNSGPPPTPSCVFIVCTLFSLCVTLQ